MGVNQHGQLGLKDAKGSEEELQLIDLVQLFGRFHSKVVAKKVVCGSHHTVMLAQPMGELYLWGSNAQSQLGDPSVESIAKTPILLAALQGQTVIDVSAGAKHTVAVLDEGDVYTWGANSDGQCGQPRNNRASRLHKDIVKTPTIVANFKDERAFKVACGAQHTLVLCVVGAEFIKSDDDSMFSRLFFGKVVSFGSNRCGQLGRDTSEGSSWCIQDLSNLKVVEIAAGHFHSMALLHDGTLYSWGFGEQGRLGLGDELTRTRPVMLDPLPHNMLPVRIQCGGQHSLAITNDGALFAWGRGKEGQLGLGDRQCRMKPARVKHLQNKMVLQVSAGNISTACMCDNRKLYLWGCLQKGACVRVPQIMKSLMMATAHSVYCGYNSVFAVMESFASPELDPKTNQEYKRERAAYCASLDDGDYRTNVSRVSNQRPRMGEQRLNSSRFSSQGVKQVLPRKSPNTARLNVRPLTSRHLDSRPITVHSSLSMVGTSHQSTPSAPTQDSVEFGMFEDGSMDLLLTKPNRNELDNSRIVRFFKATDALDDTFFEKRWSNMFQAELGHAALQQEAGSALPSFSSGHLFRISTSTQAFGGGL